MLLVVQSFRHIQPLWSHGLQHARVLYLSLSPRICSNSCPLSRWCHPTISSSVTLFSCPPFSQRQGLFQWVSSSHRWPKFWSFSFSISLFSEYCQQILTNWHLPRSLPMTEQQGHLPSASVETEGFPGGSEVKACASNAGDLGSIPGSGRSPGEGNGNPLQYSCLENSMDGRAW